MAVSGLNEHTLRPREHLLLWAFCFSIGAHLLLYADWKLLGHTHLNLLPAWMLPNKPVLAQTQKKQPAPLTEQEVPLLFVDVDPSQATAEAPKNAKYYSARNSQAANINATVDSSVPKIDGSQTHVVQTQTVPRANPVPLQPAPPKAPARVESTTEAQAKPKGGPQTGDLAMAKPSTQTGQNQSEGDTGQADSTTHTRPRTLAEAKARQAMMSGEKMKQDGGVKRRLEINSLDARATPFGEYDRELIEAVTSRWYNLLDSKQFSRDGTGRVVIDFRLDYNGHISGLTIVNSDVNDLLAYVCRKSISDPAPFAQWPTDMRRLIGADYRDIRFTFYYE
jgi:hypothetical protein